MSTRGKQAVKDTEPEPAAPSIEDTQPESQPDSPAPEVLDATPVVAESPAVGRAKKELRTLIDRYESAVAKGEKQKAQAKADYDKVCATVDAEISSAKEKMLSQREQVIELEAHAERSKAA